jgi:hypothetical protein
MRHATHCALFALLVLLSFGLAAQQAPVVKMVWEMPSDTFQFRDAHLIAYPVAASDFEVPLRVAYLADLDTYVWQFRAEIPAQYSTGDWVLYGQGGGMAVALTFRVKDGAVGVLTPVPFPRPTISYGATLASVGFNPPAVQLQGITWEVLVDGKAIENHSMDTTPPTKARTYMLRGTLPGGPKVHYLLSESAEVLPDAGSQT